MWTIWAGQDELFGVKQMDPEVAQQNPADGTEGLNAYNQEGWPQLKTVTTTVRITF